MAGLKLIFVSLAKLFTGFCFRIKLSWKRPGRTNETSHAGYFCIIHTAAVYCIWLALRLARGLHHSQRLLLAHVDKHRFSPGRNGHCCVAQMRQGIPRVSLGSLLMSRIFLDSISHAHSIGYCQACFFCLRASCRPYGYRVSTRLVSGSDCKSR